jgi:hypothetical protein
VLYLSAKLSACCVAGQRASMVRMLIAAP